MSLLELEFGKQAPLTVTQGSVHEYLGMMVNFSMPGMVKFSMQDYIQGIIDECPKDLQSGAATSLAANHLFQVNPNAEKLNQQDADLFHHLTAKLLYLSKHVCPDLETAVAFLTTRVKAPDVDDYKKLGRCLQYLHEHLTWTSFWRVMEVTQFAGGLMLHTLFTWTCVATPGLLCHWEKGQYNPCPLNNESTLKVQQKQSLSRLMMSWHWCCGHEIFSRHKDSMCMIM